MKKYLLMLLIIVGIRSESNSQIQTNVDTLCFPVNVVRERLIEAKQGRILKSLVDTLNKEIRLLDGQIAYYKQALSEKENQSSIDRQTQAAMQEKIDILYEQKRILGNEVTLYQKAVKRANQKTIATGAVGFVLIVLSLLKR